LTLNPKPYILSLGAHANDGAGLGKGIRDADSALHPRSSRRRRGAQPRLEVSPEP